MQVLLSNVMIDAVYTTLQDGKVAFDCVRRDANTVLVADVFFSSVVHRIVLVRRESASENAGAIRHYVRIFMHHLLYYAAKILRCHLRHVDGLHAAPTLQHRNDRGLISKRALAILCALSRLHLHGLRLTALST